MWKGLCGLTSAPQSEREMSANHEAALHLNEMKTTTRSEMPSLRPDVDDDEDPKYQDHRADKFDFGDPCNEKPFQGQPPVQDHVEEHLPLQPSISSRGRLCTPSK